MWMKTVDDEYINTNTLIEMRATYVPQYNYTLVIGTAVTGQEYFLKQQEGVAVGMLNDWIKRMCRKMNKEE